MTAVKPSIPTTAESPRGGSFTLQRSDNGVRFVIIAPFPSVPITVTVPDPGVLGNGFQCRIINDSGDIVTIDGRGVTDVTMADGDVARIFEANQKQRVIDESSTVVGDLAPPGPSWQPVVFGYDFDLVHWWDATTNVALDPVTGLVSSWTDKVRNTPTTQTVVAQQPTWVNGDEIRFNGVGIGLNHTNFSRACYESKWWQMIFRVNWSAMASSSDTYFFALDGIADVVGQKQPLFRYLHATHQVTTDWYSDGGLLSVTVDVPGADDTWHSLICRRTDTHIYASVDGAAEVSLACRPRSGFSGGNVGGYFGNVTGTGSQVTSIGIDSLLYGQRSISTDEIAKAHAWAMWRRGAQAHLDASSPYLSAAPTMVDADIHVADPDSYATGYRFPTTGGWDDTTRGTALDLTGYTRTFHDHFTDISTITDGLTGAGPWFAPSHLNTSGARFTRPTESPNGPGTFRILPDNTTLQIKMSKLPAPDTHYASGHIQTGDWWRNDGFLQSVPTGGASYFEARMAFNGIGLDQFGATVNPAPGWPAFWLYTPLDSRDATATKVEIDVCECYGDNTTSTRKLHIACHRHGAYRPQPGNQGSPGNTGQLSHSPSKIVDVVNAPFGDTVTTLFNGTGDGNPGTFHTYGLKIDATWITYYFDGLLVSRFPTYSEALGPLYMLVSLQSQDLSGASANCETYLWVDYVDAWVHT